MIGLYISENLISCTSARMNTLGGDAPVDLTMLIVTINSWNRINAAARTIGGLTSRHRIE